MNFPPVPIFRLAPCGDLVVAGIVALLTAALPAHAEVSVRPAITQVAAVRALTRGQAAEARPVRVRGVVNWMPNATAKSFFFADESGGIAVVVEDRGMEPARLSQNGLESSRESLTDGTEVEVDGVTSAGGYAPVILASEVRMFGRRSLPAARKVSLASLQAGGEDAQRVQLEPLVVQSVVERQAYVGGRVLRACSASGHYILISAKPAPWNDPALVVDAEVVVTGIVLTLFNSRQELTGLRLGLARQEDFQIVKPPPTDAFAAPKVEIGALRLFRPEGVSPHRCTVEGTVTLIASDGLVIQDKGRGLEVRSTPTVGLQIGDRVRIAGFVEPFQAVAFLTSGLVQKLAAGAPPAALATTPEEILKMSQDNIWRGWDKFPDDFDHRLVRLEGSLIGNPASGATEFSVQTKRGQPIPVRFAPGSRGLVNPPDTDSLLALTGVAIVKHPPGKVLPEYIQPTGVELLLRGPEDVQVLRAPPWWNATRLFVALALAVLVGVLASVWVLLLRRTVRRQAAGIEETLRAHRDSELEMLATRDERHRLAADLHDGLQQHLTGASFRLEAAVMRLGEIPTDVQEQITAARSALERTRTGLRECLVGLRQIEEGPAEFPALLRYAAGKMEHWPKGVVEITTEGTPFPVSRQVMGSLLLLMQEGVGNAFKHASPHRVRVSLRYLPETLELSIEDDGAGFDLAQAPGPGAGHFGLESMRHRLRWLGGKTEITSQPGTGTRVLARLDRTKAVGEDNAPASPAPAGDSTP